MARRTRRDPSVVPWVDCESCDHVWEPSLADLGVGPVMCAQCGGWTTIAELATTVTRQRDASQDALLLKIHEISA
jgi:hypothetical protein